MTDQSSLTRPFLLRWPMTPLRVVLDTNVVLSALLFASGSLAWLRHAWQSDAIRPPAICPLASRDTVTELIRVLSYPKFKLTGDERDDLLGDDLPWCETVTEPTRRRFPPAATPSTARFWRWR